MRDCQLSPMLEESAELHTVRAILENESKHV